MRGHCCRIVHRHSAVLSSSEKGDGSYLIVCRLVYRSAARAQAIMTQSDEAVTDFLLVHPAPGVQGPAAWHQRRGGEAHPVRRGRPAKAGPAAAGGCHYAAHQLRRERGAVLRRVHGRRRRLAVHGAHGGGCRDNRTTARYGPLAVLCSRELQRCCLSKWAIAFHIGVSVPAHRLLCLQRASSQSASTLQPSDARCCLIAQRAEVAQRIIFVSAVQGGDLRRALWRDYLDGTHAFDWRNKGHDVALAIARGLHFLHQHNVVHRQGGAGSHGCDCFRTRYCSSIVGFSATTDRCCALLILSCVAVTRFHI